MKMCSAQLLTTYSTVIQISMFLSIIHPARTEQHVEVPENYDGSFPWYLTKINVATEGQYNLELTGNDEGIFGIDAGSNILYATMPFDREQQAVYRLQVTAKNEAGEILFGPIFIQIIVKDVNDNKPVMAKDMFSGRVSRGMKQEKSFMHINATDLDDPSTANGDLRYQIFSQTPKEPSENMFQINARTGGLSLTAEGASLLHSSQLQKYNLVVQVKDMGDQPLGFYTFANIEIEVVENTWTSPGPILLPENLSDTYPKIISRVNWNSKEVHYYLEGNFPEDLFQIDPDGNIYVKQELDREVQSEYQIQVFAVNEEDVLYDEPLELNITVTDRNDNKPLFTQEMYYADIKEQTAGGAEIVQVSAEDADDPNSSNSDIYYKIISQEPRMPSSVMFHINEKTGMITLQNAELKTNIAKQYSLQITAFDLGGKEEGLSSTCTVVINVVDVNDSPPVFLKSQFGPFIIPEDTETGVLIATLTASDEDEKAEYKLIDFTVVSGNEDGMFEIVRAEQNGVVHIFLEKELDYEKIGEYTVIVSAKNEAPLLGVQYGVSSTATVHMLVENINEAPVFTSEKYEVDVLENLQPGTVVVTVKALEPDTTPTPSLRYSLRNDSTNWFSMDEMSGEIQLIQLLDRELVPDLYIVEVIAWEKDSPSVSATAEVVIHLVDVNDNYPILVGDYSEEFLCTPQQEGQAITLSAFDRDSIVHSTPFIFSLSRDPTVQRNWRIDAINDTHARLSMGISWLEPKVHLVPVTISDSGTPLQYQHIQLPVTICKCIAASYCFREVGRMEGMPTIFSAVSLIVGTLGVMGFFLLIIFVRLFLLGSSKKKTTRTSDTIPLQSPV
ncbi:cadherin-16 isoform X3 [Microcaecilia unicolor]|uniref:Cadherin-16 isoform X2 n=1 Tax=Microcaecilia unicolor TaxID=1415580 RepID=A0A6P7YBA7_9AMPH|nr:cadherin-16 isoform X2 [Microcaecilia unicolor]XP_030060325.1 cadherin-16 isoform X3 [Microcaecilia unicolor]